jgi:FkbM family methyltransferase
MYYSQQNEDKFIYENYLNYKNGFFIELGAMDGITFSNTLFFEKELNWNGMLIEPTIDQFENLKFNRPNCLNFNYAISETDGEIDFLGNHALGGILSKMSDHHRIGWGLDKLPSYKVKSKPFYKILEGTNIERVDFFSIDVEGGELDVLKTFNWGIPVYLILIEMDGSNENKDESCRNILLRENFLLESKIGNNEIWINHNNKPPIK